MNNTFNIKRFGLVFRKDFIENGKRYLLLFLTMLGIMAIIMTFYSWKHYQLGSYGRYLFLNRILLEMLSFLFFGFGIWFASTFVSPMNNKLKRLSYLISPSSNLEKYLVRWIITTIGFIIAFFAAMWIADILRIAICSVKYPYADIKLLDITKLVAPKDNNNWGEYVVPQNVFIIMISIYFLLQSVFLLGSTFWEKSTFIKTFSAVAVIVGAYLLICRWAILLFYGNMERYGNVISSFKLDQYFSEDQMVIFTAAVFTVFSIIFWILSFFRMKESEIIKRI